ncbi:hypothetical protein BB561_003783 [Smittium simulii]|uniref:Myb-like domain-containing protein n=1 Tax=Smittium simulii TaxID=133385 RepID=A0A2T9YJI6_9FUNG|nr:hypothetical protein BB561_003783 [Smittium simulii]
MIINNSATEFTKESCLSSLTPPSDHKISSSSTLIPSTQHNSSTTIYSQNLENNSFTSIDRLTNLLLSVLDIIPANQLLSVFNHSLNQALQIRIESSTAQKDLATQQEPNLLFASNPQSQSQSPTTPQNLFIGSEGFLRKEEEEIFHKNLESNLETLFLQVYSNPAINTPSKPNETSSEQIKDLVNPQNTSQDFSFSPNYSSAQQEIQYNHLSCHSSGLSFNSPQSLLPNNQYSFLPQTTFQSFPANTSSASSTESSFLCYQDPIQHHNHSQASQQPNNHEINQSYKNFQYTPIPTNSTEKLIAEFPGLISESVYDIASALHQISELDSNGNFLHPFNTNLNDDHFNSLLALKHDNINTTDNLNQFEPQNIISDLNCLSQNSPLVNTPFSQILLTPKKSNILSVNEKWLSSNNLKKLRQIYGVSYLKGRFTPNENKIINAIITHLCNDKGWSKETLEQFLFQKNPNDHEEYTGVWTQICKSIPNRPLQAMYHHIKRMFNPKNHQGNWTPDQDEKLAFWYERLGPRWEIIGRRIGRTGTNCRDRWRNIKQGNNRQTGRWSPDEKKNLLLSVLKVRKENGFDPPTINFGEDIGVSWELVSAHVQTRNASQCRGKWISFASISSSKFPELNQNSVSTISMESWPSSADLALVNSAQKIHSIKCFKVSWKSLVADLTNSGFSFSINQLKSRWTYLTSSTPSSIPNGLSIPEIAKIISQHLNS